MSLLKSFFTISVFTLISRILGFVRDIMVASYMGTGPVTEAFLVAFKLPNFFRRLFAEGAFNAAFIPMFSSILTESGRKRAVEFGEKILSVLFFILLVFTILMEIAMPLFMYVLAPGFIGDKDKMELTIYLTRITFPYLLFVSLVSLYSGILNSIGKFASVAASPILLNIFLISALYFAANYTETPAHALSYGVALAGVAQFIWLVFFCARAGIKLRLHMPKMNPQVKKFLKKMVPGIIGSGAVQINLWLDVIIATFIPGGIAFLYYADRVNQLPLSLIGTAMSVALLPMLSRQIKGKMKKEAINSQNRALELTLFFVLPATAAFCTIPNQIISVLFERGQFSADSSLATSYALIAFALGLPAFVSVKIFSSAFFARGDTKTPVKIAIQAVIINALLNIILVLSFKKLGFMPHIGIALATAISSWFNVISLHIILVRQGEYNFDKRLKDKFIRIILSVAFMVAALLTANEYLTEYFIAGQGTRAYAFIALLFVGVISYFIAAIVTDAFDRKYLAKILLKKK